MEKIIMSSVMSDQRISLGRQLAGRRQELGWTIRDLARRIGRQPSRVSETETGKANSSIDSLAEMASVMRMRIMLVPEEHVDGVMSLISPSAGRGQPYPTTTPPPSVFEEVFIEDPRESDDHS